MCRLKCEWGKILFVSFIELFLQLLLMMNLFFSMVMKIGLYFDFLCYLILIFIVYVCIFNKMIVDFFKVVFKSNLQIEVYVILKC